MRKMEALKVNKLGQTYPTYRTGTQAAQGLVVRSNYFLFNLYANVQSMPMKRDMVTAVIYYYTTTEFHHAKRDSRLSAYGGVGIEVSYF